MAEEPGGLPNSLAEINQPASIGDSSERMSDLGKETPL